MLLRQEPGTWRRRVAGHGEAGWPRGSRHVHKKHRTSGKRVQAKWCRQGLAAGTVSGPWYLDWYCCRDASDSAELVACQQQHILINQLTNLYDHRAFWLWKDTCKHEAIEKASSHPMSSNIHIHEAVQICSACAITAFPCANTQEHVSGQASPLRG